MSRDLRSYARQTTVRLIAGGLFFLLIVGIGLIYVFYGPAAAVSGLLCMGIGLLPILLILIVFAILDAVVKRANRD
jgi:hypothetical protein